jgi:serine/threonine-protein kinase HipA
VNAPASAGLPDPPALVAAADRYTRGLPDALGTDPQNDPGLRLLFRAGSSPGGARPKALILDQGIHWLAKFPDHKDEVDMVRVEAACLELARRAGVEVPDFRVVDMGHSTALLVRRFDVPKDGAETGGRHHMVSLSTLLGAEDYYQLGYEGIAEYCARSPGARRWVRVEAMAWVSGREEFKGSEYLKFATVVQGISVRGISSTLTP